MCGRELFDLRRQVYERAAENEFLLSLIARLEMRVAALEAATAAAHQPQSLCNSPGCKVCIPGTWRNQPLGQPERARGKWYCGECNRDHHGQEQCPLVW